MVRAGGALAVVLVVLASAGEARAEELKILSAGALEPAMTALADGFRRATGHTVRVEFATAAEIRERGRARLTVELVAAPEPVIAELAKANRVVAKPVPLGRVGLGIVMRAGSRAIDVSTTEALRAALLAATAVVYNRASSGQGIEALIMKLGLTEQLAPRTLRFPDAESVMRHMMSEGAGAIGFGAPTAIGLYTGPQLQYVGPVPPDLQSYTSYGIISTVAATPLAQVFLRYLGEQEARALIKAAGVE
jgi:molybdate transport system substrate-binding protein